MQQNIQTNANINPQSNIQAVSFETNRLNYLWKTYGLEVYKQFVIREQKENVSNGTMAQNTIDSRAKDKFIQIMNSDPSKNKSAVQWLCQIYLQPNPGFLWEDLGDKTLETLTLFSKYHKKLEDKQRNLYNYASLAEVYRAIEPFEQKAKSSDVEELSGKALKRLKRDQMYAESIIVGEYSVKNNQQSTDVRIVVPLTKAAAQWWGQGTRWCTSAEKNNYFDNYNRDAPLVIISLQTGATNTRLQMQVKEKSLQFMDATDENVDPNFVKENYNLLKPVIEWALAQNPEIVKYIPYGQLEEQDYKNAINRDGQLIALLPNEAINLALCLSAIEQNADSFYRIPTEYRNKETFLKAIYNDKKPIHDIKWQDFEKYKNKEMLNWIAENNPSLLGRLEDYQTQDLVNKAISNSTYKNSISFYNIKDEFLNEEVYVWAVKNSRLGISSIPEQYRTSQVYWASIKQDPSSIENIPKEEQTDEMWVYAIKNRYFGREDFPKDLFTQKFVNLLYKADALDKVNYIIPKQFLDYKMCLQMVKKDGQLSFIPKELIDYELCFEAVQKNEYALSHIPEHLIDARMVQAAVYNSGEALEYVPEHLRTAEICKLAVEHYGWALSYVPEQFRTRELCLIALKDQSESYEQDNMSLLPLVPKQMIDAEMIELAKNNLDSFQYIPENFRTINMYAQQVYHDSNRMQKVPENIQQQVHNQLELFKKEEAQYSKTNVKWTHEILNGLKEKVYQYKIMNEQTNLSQEEIIKFN